MTTSASSDVSLRVAERTEDDGALTPILLAVADGHLEIVVGSERLALPEGAPRAVFARLGAPLDAGEPVCEIGRLELASGVRVAHVRHLDRFDVIARDYVVLEADGEPPLVATALPVVRALEHLARAWRAAREGHAAAGAQGFGASKNR